MFLITKEQEERFWKANGIFVIQMLLFAIAFMLFYIVAKLNGKI